MSTDMPFIREERFAAVMTCNYLGLPPIRLEPGKKYSHSDEQPLSRKEIHEIWGREDANYGIKLDVRGKLLCVLDADGPAGEQKLKELELDSNTKVRTPKGLHVYFRHNIEGLKTRIRIADLLDIKVTGHVVGPCCQVEGKVYQAIGFRHYKCIPEAPPRLIEMIRADMQRSMAPKALPQLSSTAGTNRRPDIKDPRKFALKIESVQGQGGSKGLVRCVTLLRDCGWSPDQIFEFVAGEWNAKPTTSPPWTPEEIARCVNRHCK